jgi:hypothetical protein
VTSLADWRTSNRGTARARYVAIWEFFKRGGWGNRVRSGTVNKHGLHFIADFGSRPLHRNTLCSFRACSFMASSTTAASSNWRTASAAISNYSCRTEGHDKKDTLQFEMSLNFAAAIYVSFLESQNIRCSDSVIK